MPQLYIYIYIYIHIKYIYIYRCVYILSYSGLELTAPSLLGAPRFRGSALDESLFDQHQSTPPLATYISGLLRECVVYTISECLDSAQIVFWCIETQLPPHIMLPLL